MAENETASIIELHQPANEPAKRPLTSAERNRAFRQRQKERSAVRKSAKPAQPIEKPKPSADTGPTFAALERTTAELIEACQRGIEAARTLRDVA
jgi:hypothetical protein